MGRILTIALVVALFASGASADTLWNNGLLPNGVSARGISPPAFPAVRVADDFVVPDGETWLIDDAHFNVIEDFDRVPIGWLHNGSLTVTFYEDVNNLPGGIIAERKVDGEKFERMLQNDQYFGRDDYDYWATFNDEVHLGAGKYWIGIRNALGGGCGGCANYWMTSDGGPDGPGSKTGAFSLDEGNTWMDDVNTGHLAFEISGVLGTCTDADGDGFGNGDNGNSACPNGTAIDCDDTNAGINPGATEVCDGLDNDCDGIVGDISSSEWAALLRAPVTTT